MNIKIIKLKETESTNSYLRQYTPKEGEDLTVVTTEFQTAGRGQGKNTWESNKGENLLFSILCHPKNVLAKRQFILSQAIALAVRLITLQSEYLGPTISLIRTSPILCSM